MMLRLFIAVELADPVREALGAMQTRLKQVRSADVRWVDPEGAHLTLQFLGAVPPEHVPLIEAAVRRAATAGRAHTLRISGAGGFPNARRARVLWAGVAGDTHVLKSLVAELGSQLAPVGYPPETRPFSPHLTLGRARDARGVEGFEAAIEELSESTEVDWRVEHVCIVQSHLSPAGARYEVLARVGLGP